MTEKLIIVTAHCMIIDFLIMILFYLCRYLYMNIFNIDFVYAMITLWGDKVSMLTHIYPHKPRRKIEVTTQNHQADSPLCVWPSV